MPPARKRKRYSIKCLYAEATADRRRRYEPFVTLRVPLIKPLF
jgi:hypothetical protein